MANKGFIQNAETLPRRLLPLVEENTFLTKEPDTAPLPVYEEIKDLLPSPVWEKHGNSINCYWKAWELAFSHLRTPIPGTKFVSNYIDTCFDNWLFMWDSCFILMFGKYADRIFHFQGTLDNLYAHQHKDGFISRQIHEETGLDRFSRYNPSGTGPDVMPWCEWEYYLNFGKKDRLEKVFPVLMAFHRWMAEYHTWPDGTYFSTGWGCGMDNSPRVMPGYSEEFSHGHMIWVDACMQELNNCNILIEMAQILGREEFIEELKAERDLLEKVINKKLWNEEAGFYYDLWRNGKHNMVHHVGAFWALLAKCASTEQAQRLISYLEDENQFKTEHRVPTLAKSHEKYDKRGNYWLGSVWAPTNYMVLRGLDQYENYDLAHEIALENLYAVVEVFKEKGTLYENYAPEYVNDGKPDRGSASRADFVGWSGLFPITVLFEFVFGIKPDATKNKITWHVNLTEKHGIEKYPFGTAGELTLLCESRRSTDEKPQITLVSNVPVVLEVIWGGKGHKQSMCILPQSLC